GTPKVGGTLHVKQSSLHGFTGTKYEFVWSVDGVASPLTGSAFYLEPETAGTTITLTATSEVDGEQATATAGPVTQDPVFVDADGAPVKDGADADHPLVLTTTAGEAFTHTFRAEGSPAPTYGVTWYDEDWADEDDPTWTPDQQLPDGFRFEAATGVLSGTTDWATDSEFAITATSGGVTTTQYVEVDVEAAAPLGVQVFTTDKADFDKFLYTDDDTPSGTITSWIIDAEGTVYTDVTTITAQPDGSEWEDDVTTGGTPTVTQGGTLIVNGGLVDRFGNDITDGDGESLPIAVTSDIASDRIVPDPDLGDFGFVDVTFPHASTHNLTVESQGFTTGFAVTVNPTVAVPTAADTDPSATRGELAFTGSESAGLIPWALGLLAAGAAITGLRIARRRTQRTR
ncbi:MAG: hypothetical protein INR72_16840, partial [Williamsia herbipolensis]|nr:hypothetical protein [Williamsia herbipolensis]